MPTNIFTAAKKFYHGNTTWQQAITKAKNARKSSKPRSSSRKKIRKAVRKKVARVKRATTTKRIASVGSIAQNSSTLKHQLQEKLAWLLFSRDQLKTKRGKRKVSKQISDVRRKLNVL